jgi:hypothetical protein
MSKSKKNKPLSLPPENPKLKLTGSSRTSTHFDQRGQKISNQVNAVEIHGDVAGSNIIIGNNNEVALDKPIVCPKCKHENLRTAKSCAKCGTSLIFTCPICKSETLLGSKFCSGCGQEISLLIEQSKKNDNEK